MSGSKDDDERRRRSLESGREMLEKYKAERSAKAKEPVPAEEISDEESFQNDKSLEGRDSCAHEGISLRDITQSSVSMSEGEAEGDLEVLLGRVAVLQQELQGKEAVVEALNAEYDHLRVEDVSPNSSQSQASSIQGKDMIYLYHSKLQEFEKAITQRDNLIEELTGSVQQALTMRNGLVAQINSLNAMQSAVHTSLQEKIVTLETTVTEQKLAMQKLSGQLTQVREHAQSLELEKESRNAEINDYKLQIKNLNEQIRQGPADKNLDITQTLEQQKQYEGRIEKIQQNMQHIVKKFTEEMSAKALAHQQELSDVNAKHEAELSSLKLKQEDETRLLKEDNKILTDRLKKELPDLESRHAKELSVFQTQLAHYKKTVETLKLELVSSVEAQKVAEAEVSQYRSKVNELRSRAEKSRRSQDLTHEREKEMLAEQIELHKIQLEDLTAKCTAMTAVLDSKESIERSLEQAQISATQLKNENSCLKFKLDDLSSRYSAAQSLIENSQSHEKTLSNRIYDLEKSLSRLSGIDASILSGLNETTYQKFDEAALQYHAMRNKLDEKEEVERRLKERMQALEKDAQHFKEELEESNRTKNSYEKQLKDMRNTCDKYKSELSALRESPTGAQTDNKVPELKHIAADQQELKKLREILEEKESEIESYVKQLQEYSGKVRKSEEECDQLKNGLTIAYAQCAEFEQKLNQSSVLSESKMDSSMSTSNYGSALIKQLISKLTDSTNTTYDQSLDVSKSMCEKEDDLSTKSMQAKLEIVLQENQKLCRELDNLVKKQFEYEEASRNLSQEKQRITDENQALKQKLQGAKLIQDSVNHLRREKDSLCKEVKELISIHDEQILVIKRGAEAEWKKMQNLLLTLKEEGATKLSNLRAELEGKHKTEVEGLRTYFEQKCREIEKHYSDEVFSQQSKKMSDNDSEIEQLTDNIYFGGGGDCFNASNLSGDVSRSDTPLDQMNPRSCNLDADNTTDLEYDKNVESLRRELEKKIREIQDLRLGYEKMLEEQKNTYERELREKELGRVQNVIEQHCQTEWDAGALETGELCKLREAYDHQLAEQLTQAKLDIVTHLQEKIEAFLTTEEDGEDNWPSELLGLRDKFTSVARRDVQQLTESHAADLLRLKEEHSRILNRMIDRHREEIERFKEQQTPRHFTSGELDADYVLRERDNLQKMCATLKALVEELIKYFVICEEEVNSTLITEVLKRQLSDSILQKSQTEETDGRVGTQAPRSLDTSEVRIKRVHFAPRSTEIVSILKRDSSTLHTIMEEEEDITEKLKQELHECLLRLKHESAEILGVSLPGPADDQLGILSKEIMNMNRENEELNLKLKHAENLILEYQEEAELLKVSVIDLQRKLTNFENKKEIITEGYGENDEDGGEVTLEDFSQLQEKARHMVSNGGGDVPYMLQLVEEFCRQSSKLMDVASREKEDLQQQIEAADKQLRSTRKFMDEQASEREAERDETAKLIQHLREQLKERDREKERESRITSEPPPLSPESPSPEVAARPAADSNASVEALESQIRELTSAMSSLEAKKLGAEIEREAAVEQIWMLRAIVTDHEQQVSQKTEKEESLLMQIGQLETVIAAQTKHQQELVQELDSIKMGVESRQLTGHINYLQEELRKHKLSSEEFNVNSAALKQMKVELRDMQSQLDKRIKELESMHMCGSTLSISQPSEDVSIREQIDANRCPTPDDPTSPPFLPLDHLLKLKEKLQKHARAEDVVLKRIKDLELQLNTLKTQNEELQEEQEILQQTASEQLYQIEAMRGRLEQHKQSAPFAQRQATSRLELQLHEANAKYHSLERTIADKDLELKEIQSQLERVNQLLAEKEGEIASVVQLESVTIKKLKDQVEILEEEKRILQAKLGVQQHTQQLELPQLIDSMLADKNEEIDHLKEQLSKKEKQLEVYSCVDETQLRELARQNEPKNSARTLSDILSIHSECEEMEEAIRATQNGTQNLPHNVSSFRVPAKDVLDASVAPFGDSNKFSILVPPLELGSHSNSSSNSSQQPSHLSFGLDLVQSGCESRLLFSEESKLQQSSAGPNGVADQTRPSSAKFTQTSLEEQTLNDLEKLQELLRDTQAELQNKVSLLERREADLAILQRLHEELQNEFRETVETLARDKRFYQDQYELSLASENKIKKDLMEVENTMKSQAAELQEHKNKMHMNEKIVMELNSDNNRLKKDVEAEKEKLKQHIHLLQEHMKELQHLKDLIMKKDVTIETIQTRNIEIEHENKQLYEYKTKYESCKQDMSRLQEMVSRTSLSGSSTPSEGKLHEIQHLQECLKEKDRVIKQMSDDTKSLHRALETIQSKMKESGNVVELRKQLKDERKLNADLQNMVEKLSKELGELKIPVMQRSQEESDIEDMVQRELNLSAHLDRQLLNAIESDVDEGICRLEKNRIQEGTVQELKLQLNLANKLNEELRKMKDDMDVKKELLECQIKEYESRIFQLKADLGEEYKKVAMLDKELSAERRIVRTLKIQIERDQRNSMAGRKQDTELIELLREKLKSTLDSEAKLRSDLSMLRQENKHLEMQVTALKEHMQSQQKDTLPKIADVLDNERKKYLMIVEKCEKEERNNAELRDVLKRTQMEKNRYEKQLELANDEKEKLISSLALVEGVKEYLDSDLRRTKVELKAKEEECEWLQKRIKTMTDAESKRHEQRTSDHNELKSLRRELNNAREFMTDLEADMKQSKTESLEREEKLEAAVKALQDREVELLEALSSARQEDRKSKDTINDLQQELKMVNRRQQDLSKELKNRYSNEKNAPEKLIEKISDLSDANERFVNDKAILREKLLKSREEKEHLIKRVKSLESELRHSSKMQNVNLQNPVFMKKLEYFCSHYLRAESMRKALAFQKNMLITSIRGHEMFEENTFSMVMRLVGDGWTSSASGKKKKPKPKRFKSVALVLISIRRMKWLSKNLRHKRDAQIRALFSESEPSYVPVRRAALNHSPPVRERGMSNGVDGGGFELNQYYQRIRNIQETLGLAMADSKPQQL